MLGREANSLNTVLNCLPGAFRAIDLVALTAAGLLVHALAVEARLQVYGLAGYYAAVSIIGALLFVVVLGINGGYRMRLDERPESRAFSALTAWLVTSGLLMALGFALQVSDNYSRLWAAGWFGIGLGWVLLSRGYLAWQARRWIASGRVRRRVAVVGVTEQAERMIAQMRRQDDPTVEIIGVFADEGGLLVNRDLPRQVGGVPVCGSLDDLIWRSRSERIDNVVLTLPWTDEARVRARLARLRSYCFEVSLAPDLIGADLLTRPIGNMSGVPVLRLASRPLENWSALAKRAEDLVLGGLMMLFLAPLFAVIAIAIKLDSPGPVFFRQRRYGFNYRTIDVFKFRTMYADRCDAMGARLTTGRDDPRITRVGRVLRRTSLDELPQLFNVLMGEMSLVGPRPHPLQAKAGERLYDEVIQDFCSRYRVRPGITGWAQVNGARGSTDTEQKLIDRFQYDLFYVEHWSLLFDLKILFRTIFKVIDAENAY
jgi:Undecaprenyl-phosphate glucose phosphotransferase